MRPLVLYLAFAGASRWNGGHDAPSEVIQIDGDGPGWRGADPWGPEPGGANPHPDNGGGGGGTTLGAGA